MIDPVIKQIRKDFSDRMIFLYSHGKPALGFIIHEIEFDIDRAGITGTIQIPGAIQEITIASNWRFSND